MTSSNSRHITDELLSAYIDGEITEQERTLIERALAQDEQIAWRLNSLRQTVTLLRDLPEMALPRTFTLMLDHAPMAQSLESPAESTDVAQTTAPRATRIGPSIRPTQPGAESFWEQLVAGWHGFWQGGNPMLRNAAAVSFALLLLLSGGGQLLSRVTQPAGMMATASESAAESAAAPAAEAVAMAPTTQPSAAAPASSDTTANKMPEANTRVMQAPAASPGETGAAPNDAADSSMAESTVAESAAAEESPIAESGEVSIAAADEAASDSAVREIPAEDEPVAEAPVAAAMAAPVAEESANEGAAASQEPPLVAALPPIPGAPRGQGGGGDGLGAGGQGDGLLPEQAFDFDVDQEGEPTALPQEEDASAAPAAAAAMPAETTSGANSEATTESVDESSEATADETTPEPTGTPTAVAVAIVAPEPSPSSDVVQAAPTARAVVATRPGADLSVLWIAQRSALLLTVVLASLWWRSRTPRRPRR